MKFTFIPQAIPDVLLIEHEMMGDARGFFAETMRADAFAAHGVPALVQENLSRSRRDVLRGLHYQKPPAAIGKLVRCTRGRIFDVAADLRRSSPTFGKHVVVELGENETRMLWVPVGFAHGFCVLSESADVLYKTTGYYAPEHDVGVRWNDPTIGVPWPTPTPILSERDKAAPLLMDATTGF
ncbi:MAG: dTDP-4-dehydrorhamnose 3,5-epimerase [Deltaproteobacteria bacterium]|nr:dTDP-4-dehydrorhamnose 3,5-epimerase [Deltaproteobacteria bacterium]